MEVIGHVNIPKQVYEFENRFHRDDIKWKREAQFMDDLQSHNWIEFFHRWFHFGSYEDVYDDVIEYFTRIKSPIGLLTYHDFDIIQGTPEENENKEVFVPCSTERDLKIIGAIAGNNMQGLYHPRFEFDKSDFNNFTEIFNSLKDGYTYSRPRQLEE